MDRQEQLDGGEQKWHSLSWGQCTLMIKNELETCDGHDNNEEKTRPNKANCIN